MPEPDRSKQIYRYSWELFKEKPHLFLQGSLKQWGAFLGHITYYGMYSYTSGDNRLRAYLTTGILYLLGVIVLVRIMLKKASRSDILAATAFLGIFASVPFVPPMDTFYLRAYGAAIAWIALLPGLGLGYLISRFPRLSGYPGETKSVITHHDTALTVLLVMMTVIVPLGLKSIITPPSLLPPECPADFTAMIVPIDPGNNLRLLEDESLHYNWVPYLHHFIFSKRARQMPRGEVAIHLRQIPKRAVITNGFNQLTGRGHWLVLPPSISISEKQVLQVCAVQDMEVAEFGIQLFYAESVELYELILRLNQD